MKLNRRRFFGAAAGAGVAASLSGTAKSDLLANKVGMPAIGGTYTADVSVPTPNPNYIANLRKAAAGELSEWELDQIDDRRREAQAEAAVANLDALRSVSMPVKRLMLADHYAQQVRSNFILNAVRELRNLTRGKL